MFDAQAIAQDLIGQAQAHHQRIGGRLYGNDSAAQSGSSLHASPLHDDIYLLARVANGDVDRESASAQQVGEVIEAIERMVDLLFTRVGEPHAHHIPLAFWAQPGIGQMLAYVQVWLRRDDLIGYTEAAQILFNDLADANIHAARMRVKRLVERGALMGYAAPDEANPSRRTRVSRLAVEALRDADAQHGCSAALRASGAR